VPPFSFICTYKTNQTEHKTWEFAAKKVFQRRSGTSLCFSTISKIFGTHWPPSPPTAPRHLRSP